MRCAAADFHVAILLQGNGDSRFQRRTHRLYRHTGGTGVSRSLLRQIRNMDKPALHAAAVTQAMQQTVHHVITDKRPRRLRYRRRDPLAAQRGNDRFDRQRAKVRRRTVSHDRYVNGL